MLNSSQTEDFLSELESTREVERFDLLDMLILLAQHKILIVKVVASCVLLALILAIALPNRFVASATILPPQQTQSAASLLMSQLGGGGTLAALAAKDLGMKNPSELFVGILRSRTIEDAIVQKFELMSVYRDKKFSEAQSDLEDASKITAGKEGLIKIAVEDKDPVRAAGIANAYISELQKIMQGMALTEASQRRLFYERELQHSKDELADAEISLKETQQRTGMIQLDTQAKAALEAAGKLRAQIAAREVEIQAMNSFATERNPDVVIAQQELSALRGQLSKLEKEQNGSGDPLIATGKLPAVGLEYIRKLRELKYRETMFELLAKQYEIARLDEGKQAAVIQVVDMAAPPDKKSSPNRPLLLLLGFGIGLLGAVTFVLFREAVNRILSHADDRSRMSLLGRLLITKR